MSGIYALVGAAVGLVLGMAGRSPALGLVAGLAIGLLAGHVRALRAELDAQRARLDALPPRRPPPPGEQKALASDEPSWPEPVEPDLPERSPPEPLAPESAPAIPAPGAPAPLERAEPWAEPKPAVDPFGRLFDLARDWLTTGNVPAKVGMLVSFFGVSFLLKYAIDRNLLNLPIEARLLVVALAGVATAAIGWRLRERRRNYALVLQGGGLGVLFLTVYAALRVWQLLPAPLAFVLLALLAAATAALAVAQNARSLAMFGVAGGFLAPLLASTGQGSHVVLFSYYLVLNLGILAIAWRRAWRGLNLLGFAFTFVIAIFWGYRFFHPELFASTEPFLVAHFLLYQAIAVLYALRRPPDRPDLVDGTLVFGTPVMAFGLQSAMLYDTEYGLALSAAALAAFYAAAAWWLLRRQERLPRLLGESYVALAVAFGTVTVPLAFGARWTTAAWALEGAALTWIGVRQQRLLATAAGVALALLAGLVFLEAGWARDVGLPVLNGNVLGGAMIALAGLFTARLLPRLEVNERLEPALRFGAPALLTWGCAWWIGTGWLEALDRVPPEHNVPALLAVTALSAAAAIAFGRWRDWGALRAATAALLPLLALLALAGWTDEGHFLSGFGWLAWPLAWAVQAWLLRDLDARGVTLAAPWHLGSLFLLCALVSVEVGWQVARVASRDWADVASIVVVGKFALAVWALRRRSAWPVDRHDSAYLGGSLVLAGLSVLAMTVLTLSRPGDSAPLAYLPVLNPLGLGTVFALVMAALTWRVARGVRADGEQPLLATIAACAFLMTSAAIVRAVHHATGVEWRFDALFDSEQVQAALSIWWGLLGFAGMVLGARRANRPVWFAGAACMALVLVKLFTVDLGNSGTVERIVSFIGTGALLLIVGYFAPVPPRPDAGGSAKP